VMAMAKVFLSYKHEDAEIANRLLRALSDAGHEVFIDTQNRPGIEFDEYIKEQIVGCDAFIVLVTRVAHASDWVRAELRVASDLARKNNGRPRIIPLVLEDFASDWRMEWHVILDALHHVRCVDLDQQWADALESITRELKTLGRSAIPGPSNTAELSLEQQDKLKGLPESVVASLDNLLAVAEDEIARRNFVAATQVLRTCESLAEQPTGIAPTHLRIRLFNDLALAIAYQRDFATASQYCVKAANLLNEHESPALRAINLHRLGYIRLQENEVFDALKHLEVSEALCRQHNLDTLRAQVHDVQGTAWSVLGLLDVAIEHYQTSLGIKTDLGDRQGQAITHGNLGRAFQCQGMFTLARDHFQKDLDLSLEVSDDDGAMMMRSCLAGLLREELRYEESLTAYRDYLHLAEAIKKARHIAFAHLGIAQVMTGLGMYDSAARHLAEAGKLVAEWFKPLVLRASAELSAQIGELKEAVFLLERTLEAVESVRGPAQEIVQTLCQLARVYARMGQRDAMSACLRRAADVARQKRLRWVMGGLRTLQSQLAERDGRLYQMADMPFPVSLLAARVDSALDASERLDRLIELFKGSLKFATSIVLADYLACGPGVARRDVDETIVRVFERRNPSTGLWAECLRVVVQAIAKHRERLAMPQVVDVLLEKVRDHYRLRAHPQECISQVLAVRNRLSHARRPDPGEAERLAQEVDAVVTRFVDSLQPIWASRLLACQEHAGFLRWRELSGPASLVHWPAYGTDVSATGPCNQDVFLWTASGALCIRLTPWWIVRWREDPEDRGDLYVFSKRAHSQLVYLNVETRSELKVPAVGPFIAAISSRMAAGAADVSRHSEQNPQ